MAAYRCAVQLNVRFRVKPPSAGLADCPTSDFRERQLSDRSAAIARENVIRRLWVGGCPPSITPPAAPFSMERPARQSRGEPSPPRSTALRKRPPNLVRDPAVLDPKRSPMHAGSSRSIFNFGCSSAARLRYPSKVTSGKTYGVPASSINSHDDISPSQLFTESTLPNLVQCL